MKSKLKDFVIIYASVALFAVLLVLGVKVYVASLDNADFAKSGCTKKGAHDTAIVQNDKVTPLHTSAHRCDTLTITNKDAEEREIAFGPHEKHVPYNGVTERLLQQDESFTIILNATGTYRFHDHEHDEVQATFTVIN